MKYIKLHGDYAWLDDRGNVQFFSHSIAIAYDADCGALHKHGPPDRIYAWVAEARQKVKGLFDFAVIESDRWDIDELNKILNVTGYVKRVAEREMAKCPTT